MAAWLLGAAALGMRLWSATGAWRDYGPPRSPPSPTQWCFATTSLGECAWGRLRSCVLRFCAAPAWTALRRPAILLPEDAEENLRETFIHELAHLGRRDGLWNLSATQATAVFWMQPLLWLLSKRLEETAEEVCDDFVVNSGRTGADMPATCSNWPSGGCRRWRRRASG